jgi:16S rRNA C967 or C1407 C5-methylase (RsmB/RsmF family)/NOL1/NOP2/fmu family ribosome biogenesis protein
MLPQDFIDRIEQMLGEEELQEFLASYDDKRNYALRVNKLKEAGCLTDAAGQNEPNFSSDVMRQLTDNSCFESADIPWEPSGRYYADPEVSGFRPGKHPYHECGAYYIQEASAMSPAAYLMREELWLLTAGDGSGKAIDLADRESGEIGTSKLTDSADRKSGIRILDLCSAPGGKTTQIASYMCGQGLLVSNEIIPNRAKILAENVERMGIRNCVVVSEDPLKLAPKFPEFFHRIMVDAPCSGEGMFRKEQEASEQWSLENVRMCGERQDYILDCAYDMLAPGGTMVYSTCTFAPDENEGSVSRFIHRHPDMMIVPVVKYDGMSDGSAAGAREFGELGEAPVAEGIEATIRLWPHKLHGEGHFLAVLHKRRLGADSLSIDYKTEKTYALKHFPELQKFAKEVLADEAYEKFADREFIQFGSQICLATDEAAPIPSLKGLKVCRVGLHLGEVKKNRFEPSHAWALALTREETRDGVMLTMAEDAEEAYKYFNGETFNREAQPGWQVVFIDGCSAGWCKVTGNTVKNHYPKGLRKNLRP